MSQREVNDLLQRKSSWSDGDVSRFTALVRQDHVHEQNEARAKAKVEETEDVVDREFNELMRAILARYHEEQVWSDKIRSASTYGSLAALGLNLVVFLLAIVIVEPWKRRRLAQTFEKKVDAMEVENRTLIEEKMEVLAKQLGQQETLMTDLMGRIQGMREENWNTAETGIPPSDASLNLSNRSVVVSGRELIVIAGSAIAGGAVALLTKSIISGS